MLKDILGSEVDINDRSEVELYLNIYFAKVTNNEKV